MYIATSLEIPMRIISCYCEPTLIEARLARRSEEGGDASDADISVMHNQLKHQQKLTDAELKNSLQIDTDSDDAINIVVSQLIAQGLVEP
jgi:predicted kinase